MVFQYADDNCVVSTSEDHLQQILNAINSAYIRLGLSINPTKTRILYQPKPGDSAEATVPSVTIGNKALEKVEHYLGSYLSSKADIQDAIQYRLKCAGAAYGRLRTPCLSKQEHPDGHKIGCLQSCRAPDASLRLRDLNNLSLSPQGTGEVPPTLPAEHFQHLLAELPHQHQPSSGGQDHQRRSHHHQEPAEVLLATSSGCRTPDCRNKSSTVSSKKGNTVGEARKGSTKIF